MNSVYMGYSVDIVRHSVVELVEGLTILNPHKPPLSMGET